MKKGSCLQINLKDCKFFSYHGFYPQEQILGNVFWVNVLTEQWNVAPINDELENTLNYETIYGIVQEEMKKPRKLLETVASTITERIRTLKTEVAHIQVTIRKETPPFGNDRATAEVVVHWTKD